MRGDSIDIRRTPGVRYRQCMTEDANLTGPAETFEMDPIPVLMALARQLVIGQKQLADQGLRIAKLPPEVRELPEARQWIQSYADLKASWLGEALPSLVASIQLTLEVHDTFGPGRTVIDDPVDAWAWNNKYHAGAKMLRTENL